MLQTDEFRAIDRHVWFETHDAKKPTLTVTDAANTQLKKDRFLMQTQAGTFAGAKKDSAEWSFRWKAPKAEIAAVRFWLAGNAADNDSTDSGDDPVGRFVNLDQATVAVGQSSWGAIKALYDE